MEDPFFRNYWNPVRTRHPQKARLPTQPKVVSVPVHFVCSDEEKRYTSMGSTRSTEASRSMAAVKIQKVVRGFLVRKNARVVHRIEAEVDEIEKRMRETKGLIRTDEKQRLILSEMLMAVLLRLDSVRGVREYRKKVIRRVISLQEAVDSITAGNGEQEEKKEIDSGELDDREQGAGEAVDSAGDGETLEDHDALPGQPRVMPESTEIHEGGGGLVSDPSNVTLESSQSPMSFTTETGGETLEAMDSSDGGVVEEAMAEEEGAAKDAVEESVGSLHPTSAAADSGKGVRGSPDPALAVEMQNSDRAGVERGMKEVMEKMVEENQKLKGLVEELCERNKMQCCLMSGLSQRVEQLERVVEKMGRKKRKCGRKL